MNLQELERLVRKYYGYVADLEGSGIETLDLLFVRDKIQRILDKSGPEDRIPGSVFEQVHELDQVLLAASETFCMVVGQKELQHARRQQRSPRSHWWWYLDELNTLSQPAQQQRERLMPVFVPA